MLRQQEHLHTGILLEAFETEYEGERIGEHINPM